MSGELQVWGELTPEDSALELKCRKQIDEGLGMAQRSWELIVPNMIIVRDKMLWREYESINDWALDHFGFGSKQLQNYIAAGSVHDTIVEHDPEADLKMTQALALDRVIEADQPIVWDAVKEALSDGNLKMTGKLINQVAKKLRDEGRIEFKEGRKSPNEDMPKFVAKSIRAKWGDLSDEAKMEFFKWLKQNEPDALLRAAAYIFNEE